MPAKPGFRDRKIAASLKHLPLSPYQARWLRFRDRKIAASLKRVGLGLEDATCPVSAIERSRPH